MTRPAPRRATPRSRARRVRARVASWATLGAVSAAIPVTLLLAWELAARLGAVNPLVLPAPSQTIAIFAEMLLHGALWHDVGATTRRLALGATLATVIALPLGSLAAFSKADPLLRPPLDFLRSLPVTALVPVFIVIFGIGEANKVVMVASSMAVIMTVQVRDALVAIPREPFEIARLYGYSGLALWGIALRFALPVLLSGLRVSLGLGLVVVVAVEMYVGGGTNAGIGHRIWEAQQYLRMREMWASIMLIGVYGYVLSLGMTWLTRVVVPWDPGTYRR